MPFPGFGNMSPSSVLTLLGLALASAAPGLDYRLDAQWKGWKTTHGKLYKEVGTTCNCPEGTPQRTGQAVGTFQQSGLLRPALTKAIM